MQNRPWQPNAPKWPKTDVLLMCRSQEKSLIFFRFLEFWALRVNRGQALDRSRNNLFSMTVCTQNSNIGPYSKGLDRSPNRSFLMECFTQNTIFWHHHMALDRSPLRSFLMNASRRTQISSITTRPGSKAQYRSF